MKADTLRKSILQMAIEGKLVPQNPADEPASVLLDKIRAEKQNLIREGKIKKDKYDSVIFRGDDNSPYEKIGNETRDITDEIPFDIPESWCWVRFKNLVNYCLGKTPPRSESKFWKNGIYPWISIADMVADGVIETTKEKVSEVAFSKAFNGRLSPKGTLIMSFKLIVGRVSYLGMDAFHNEAIISIFPYFDNNETLKKFLFKTLPLLSQNGDTKNAIKGNTLNSTSLGELLIPLPPISEQERILSCIDTFNPYISEYNRLESELSTLDIELPDRLRKSILQYAIEGKLVQQNPTDEPASVLLERIRAEKEALVKTGKIKRDKTDSYIYRGDDNSYYQGGENIDDLLPFDIPDSWAWCLLNDVAIFRKGPFGSSLTKSMFISKSASAIKVYEQKNAIQKDATLGHYYITREYFESAMRGFEVSADDIIVSCAGTIGEIFVLPEVIEKGIINQALMRVKVLDAIDKDFFILYLDYIIKQSAIQSSKGSAIKNIPPFEILKNLAFPLPPIEEQRRIVEGVYRAEILIKSLLRY